MPSLIGIKVNTDKVYSSQSSVDDSSFEKHLSFFLDEGMYVMDLFLVSIYLSLNGIENSTTKAFLFIYIHTFLHRIFLYYSLLCYLALYHIVKPK